MEIIILYTVCLVVVPVNTQHYIYGKDMVLLVTVPIALNPFIVLYLLDFLPHLERLLR